MPDFSSLTPAEIIPLIAGAVLLLFGWVLYRVALSGAGAALGGVAGLGLALVIDGLTDFSPNTSLIMVIVGVVVGAAIGLAIFHFMEVAAFFITGCAFGGWATYEVLTLLEEAGRAPTNSPAIFALIIAAGIILTGVVFVLLRKTMIGLATAGGGTLLIMGSPIWTYDKWPAIIIFVIGASFQIGILRIFRKKDKDDD